MLFYVDVIIEDPEGKLVLVDRGVEPLGWAFAGGLVDKDETAKAAAAREVMEETGIELAGLEPFHVYPFQDKEGETASLTFVFRAAAQKIPGTFSAGSDAKAIGLFLPREVRGLIPAHAMILEDYVRFLQTGMKPAVFAALPAFVRASQLSYKIAA